ncbi:MAG: DUF1501 domain-containing protein [Lentisphaeraceae bacterium]|nr:DUF1501 domain-containing protein [Lentisphaeraceae bacterium]
MNRRDFVSQLGSGMGAVALSGMMSQSATAASKTGHVKPRAKAVIQLFMNGGPSQVDTFDYKPLLEKFHGDRPKSVNFKTERPTGGLMKSPWEFKQYGKSGIFVNDIYKHTGEVIDDICVINSMHTNIPNHAPALSMMNCGEIQPIRPSMGSWLNYGLGSENENLPGYVVMCPGKPLVGSPLWNSAFLPGEYQGTYVETRKSIDPNTVIANLKSKKHSQEDQLKILDQLKFLNEHHKNQRQNNSKLEASIKSMELAFRMQTEASDAFNIFEESLTTREMYGAGSFAEACLAARRLVERGVRFVQIYSGNGNHWDHHSGIGAHENNAKGTDKAAAALITDLKRRGMLDETLVVWGGEFGRTPTTELANEIQAGGGRDHNHLGFTYWLAGGGVKGGIQYGSTDEFGMRAVENKVHVHDLHATILYLMGLDHEKLTYRFSGRDFRLTDVHGEVIKDILA